MKPEPHYTNRALVARGTLRSRAVVLAVVGFDLELTEDMLDNLGVEGDDENEDSKATLRSPDDYGLPSAPSAIGLWMFEGDHVSGGTSDTQFRGRYVRLSPHEATAFACGVGLPRAMIGAAA